MMQKRFLKKLACLCLAAALLLSGGISAIAAGGPLKRDGGQAPDAKAEPEITWLTPNDTSGLRNRFSYTGQGWVKNGSEAYIDLGQSNDQAESYFYEVHFTGSAIYMYATKASSHGKVRFSVDGEYVETADLYQEERSEVECVYYAEDLEEGEHTLKAVTLPETSGSSIVNQVNYAAVAHAPYKPTGLSLPVSGYQLTIGQTQQISYQALPSDASFTDLTFESSDDAVASVSKDGMITAKKEGKAAITLSSALTGITKTIAVTVLSRLPEFGGAIVDTDTQYTQDRLQDVMRIGQQETSLTAWKNDHAVSELALYANGKDASHVTVSSSDFTKANGFQIPSENVSVSFIKSTTAYNGGYVGGTYPAATAENRSEVSDIISHDAFADIKSGTMQPVWVDIRVPNDAEPGDYAGTLTATDAAGNKIAFSYTLHVQNASLKDASQFKGSFDIELWQYPYSSAEYYDVEPFSEEHLNILESSMRKYKEIGGYAITTTVIEEAWSMKDNGSFPGQTYSKNDVHYPSMVKWTKQPDGSFTYDYTDFDAWVSFNKSLGIGDKILLYSVAPWHRSFSYWEDGTLKYEEFTAGSARYTEVWSDFLTDLIRHLEEKGWFEDAYVGIDERGFCNEAFDLIESVKGSNGKPLKTAGAMDAIQDEAKKNLALRVSDLNVGSTAAAGNPDVFQKVLAERQAKGLRTTIYSCTGHQPGNFSMCAPVESYWTILNCAKMGTAGFLRWAYDAWVEDPLRDTTHQWFEPGDCFLIYPSEKDAEKKEAQSSIRLEKMAQGVRDVNKLLQIKESLPEFSEKVDSVYGLITTTAAHTDFLDEAARQALSIEMDAFRNALDALSEEYASLTGKPTLYSVKAINGAAEKEAYAAGETVKVKANAPASGMRFAKWKVTKGNATLKDASGAETEFIMPESDVELEATYEKLEECGGVIETESGNEIIKKKLPLLLAKGKGGKNQISLSWTKWNGADGYEVYWSYRGKKENFQLLCETNAAMAKAAHKKLNAKKQYTYFVAAFQKNGLAKTYTALSPKLYVSQKSEKTTNVKSIRLNKSKLTLKKGKTFQIKATLVKENKKKKLLKQVAECRYLTSDKKIATVDKKGKIKAKKKGKCVIYAITNNGVSAQVKVTVK